MFGCLISTLFSAGGFVARSVGGSTTQGVLLDVQYIRFLPAQLCWKVYVVAVL